MDTSPAGGISFASAAPFAGLGFAAAGGGRGAFFSDGTGGAFYEVLLFLFTFDAAVVAADVEADGDFGEREPFAELADEEAAVLFRDEVGVVHEQDERGGFHVDLGGVIDANFLGGGGAGAAEREDFLDGVIEGTS